MHAGRLSLLFSVLAVVASSVLGMCAGLVAGYSGGWLDSVTMRLMDAMLAFPGILLALAIVSALGPGLVNTLIAFTIAGVPYYARLLRSVVVSVRRRDFVLSARTLGASHGRIMARHVLPNSLTPIVIAMTLDIGATIVGIASLGYLGLGAQPPAPERGSMLSGSQTQFFLGAVAAAVARWHDLAVRHRLQSRRGRFARRTGSAPASQLLTPRTYHPPMGPPTSPSGSDSNGSPGIRRRNPKSQPRLAWSTCCT